MHIFNAGGSARWGPVPFMKKSHAAKSVARGYEGSGREFQGLNFIQHL